MRTSEGESGSSSSWRRGTIGSSIYSADCGRAVLGLGRSHTSRNTPNGYLQQVGAKTDLWGLLRKHRAGHTPPRKGDRKGSLSGWHLPCIRGRERAKNCWGGRYADASCQVPHHQHGEGRSQGPSVHPWMELLQDEREKGPTWARKHRQLWPARALVSAKLARLPILLPNLTEPTPTLEVSRGWSSSWRCPIQLQNPFFPAAM